MASTSAQSPTDITPERAPVALECRACGGELSGYEIPAREVQFGLAGEFHYGQCLNCGSLNIRDPPQDLGPFYGSNYHSQMTQYKLLVQAILMFLYVRMFRIPWLRRPLLGLFPTSMPALIGKMISHATGGSGTGRVLDVGAGRGYLLGQLRFCGFDELWGIDPYSPTPSSPFGRIAFVRTTLGEVKSIFDFIIFNHSLEHTIDPFDQLRLASERLSRGGVIMIRTPLADSQAFGTYRSSWAQLDAPRHLTILTSRAISIMSQRLVLNVREQVFDSNPFQFIGSEYIRRGLTLRAGRDGQKPVPHDLMSRVARREFRKRAGEANKLSRGDQATFFLTRV